MGRRRSRWNHAAFGLPSRRLYVYSLYTVPAVFRYLCLHYWGRFPDRIMRFWLCTIYTPHNEYIYIHTYIYMCIKRMGQKSAESATEMQPLNHYSLQLYSYYVLKKKKKHWHFFSKMFNRRYIVFVHGYNINFSHSIVRKSCQSWT